MITDFTERTHPGAVALSYVEGPAAGPPLLLLHGVTRGWRDWEPLLPELMREWRVVALDHRGHGRSARGPRYRVADYAADAAAFLRATCEEPVTILGHSLGAMVALAVAVECSPMVAAIILEDPPFHTMGRDIHGTRHQAQFAGMQQVARAGGSPEAIVDGLAAIALPSPDGPIRLGDIRDRASLAISASFLPQVDPAIFDPLIAGTWLEGYDPLALWPRVECPTLLLQGDPAAGGCFTDLDAGQARRRLAKRRHLSFPGIGHQIHRTVPGEMLQAIRDFAATASPARRP